MAQTILAGFSSKHMLAIGVILLALILGWLLSPANPFVGLLLGLVLAIVVLLVLGRLNKQPSIPSLFHQKRQLVTAMGETEKRFLNREIDSAAYNSLQQKFQEKLVRIEAQLDLQSGMQNAAHAEELQKITAKNRHPIQMLLDQKSALVQEMHLSEQKYLHRDMEENAFLELRASQQERLLELDSRIDQLQSEDATTQVLDELKNKLREIELSAQEQKRKKDDQIAKDLFEQR